MTMEFERLHDLDEPAQGDLIEWVGNDYQVPWQTYAVVVTADCDIAWKKNRGVLSYVPALMASDFMWEHWRKDRLGTHLPILLRKAAIRINRWREKNGMDAGELSDEALFAWLSRVDPDHLLIELGVTDNGQKASLLDCINPLFTVMRTLNCQTPNFELLVEAFRYLNPKSGDDPNVIVNEVQKSWGSLPGDVFHLPSMPEEATRKVDGGLFLMLRSIRQIDASLVTSRPDDVRSGKAKAKRIARVAAPFRYSITQNLARVFCDIGLPDDHEERRKSAAQNLFQGRNIA